MNRIVVFSGHAHPDLARALARRLKIPLSPSTTTTFSNDCLGVQLEDNCRQADVFIVQPLAPPVQHHLMELLLMLDAARGASAARITAVIPHFAYARSDKKDAPRISIAARLVADLLVTAGANRVLAMTLHSPQVHGFFGVPVDHMNALKVLARHFRSQRLRNTVVVSPDLGNAKEASHFARSLQLPMAAGNKKRLSDDRVVIDTLVGDVDGKNVIVLDDEIANGGTIVEQASRAASQAHRGGVYARPLHGPGDCAPWRSARHRRNRYDRHRGGSTGEATAQHEDSVDCAATRGGDSPNSCWGVRQRAVRPVIGSKSGP
jgi:ribose-phosphate pyrophosphokinase